MNDVYLTSIDFFFLIPPLKLYWHMLLLFHLTVLVIKFNQCKNSELFGLLE